MEEGPRVRRRIVAPVTQTCTLRGKKYAGTPTDPHYSVPISSPANWLTKSEDHTMNDVVTKDYKRRSANGEIINNPMDRIIVFDTYPVPEYYYRSLITKKIVNGVECWKDDVWSGLYPISSQKLGAYLDPSMFPEIAEERKVRYNQAVTEAYANSSSAEISTLMLLGEGRETVSSIASILMRAIRIITAVKRLDVKSLSKQLSPDEITDRYMEARYALRPLMYDIDGILKAWTTKSDSNVRRRTARGFAAKEWDFKDILVVSDTESVMTLTIERTLHCSAGIRAGVLTDIELSKLSIWGVDTVFETALELVPFSFIVNWFFNIASVLASWTPKAGVRALASWATETTVATSVNRLVNVRCNFPVAAYNPPMKWGGSKSRSVLRVTRNVNPTRVKFPDFDLNIDTLKMLDLTKIISQLVS